MITVLPSVSTKFADCQCSKSIIHINTIYDENIDITDSLFLKPIKCLLTGNEDELKKMCDNKKYLWINVILQLDKKLLTLLIKNLMIMHTIPIIKNMNTWELFQKYIVPIFGMNKCLDNVYNVVLRYKNGMLYMYVINEIVNMYTISKKIHMFESITTHTYGKNILNNLYINDTFFKNNINVILTLLLCINRKVIPRCIMFNVLLPHLIEI